MGRDPVVEMCTADPRGVGVECWVVPQKCQNMPFFESLKLRFSRTKLKVEVQVHGA